MKRLNGVIGLLCACTAYCLIKCFSDPVSKNGLNKVKAGFKNAEASERDNNGKSLPAVRILLTHDTVLRSLFAYDNSDHKSLVHIRLDKQTLDLLIKFKMATGVDITKFVAFSVKYCFESNPELKDLIKQFIQNTTL